MSRSEQVEHLSRLKEFTEEEARSFFAKTHVTSGMTKFLRGALKRIAGTSDQAIFELKQAMGGGKTHNQIALGLLARFPRLAADLPETITAGISIPGARVAAVNGRDIDRTLYLWGEIARQIGAAEGFSHLWSQGPKAPSESEWLRMIGNVPTIIMMDELPPYLAQAHTQTVGSGTLLDVTKYALSNLYSAALKAPNCVIVVASLDGSYDEVSTDLSMRLADLRRETARGAETITPVDLNTGEIYDIIRKRLFSRLPERDIREHVAKAYSDVLDEAVRGKALAKGAERLADEIVDSYPFHPSYKHILALFKDNDKFRQTRGLIEFTANLLRGVWAREEGVPLVGIEFLNLSDLATRDQLKDINGSLDKALASDVYGTGGDAHAQEIDAERGNDAASRVATMMYVASLSDAADGARGLPKNHFVESILSPSMPAAQIAQAFEELRDACWYIHSRDGEKFYFSDAANIRKQIEDKANRVDQALIDNLVRQRITEIFEPKVKAVYQDLHVLPELDTVALTVGKRACIVLSPDNRNPPESANRFLGEQVHKNNFCVVSGDGSRFAHLDISARRLIAIEAVRFQLTDIARHEAELRTEQSIAEKDFKAVLLTLLNTVWYPAQSRNGGPELKDARLDFAPHTHEGRVDGEAAIEAALTSIGSRKAERLNEDNADALTMRVEDMLFPDRASKSKWSDVLARAASNPRWLWVSQKDLESIRSRAVASGRWAEENGVVDKNPPPPVPAISWVDDFSRETGETRLVLSVSNAGKSPEIFVAESPEDVFGAGTRLMSPEHTTTKARLWFAVRDGDDHERCSEPREWRGSVSLTHQVTTAGDTRRVTLTARPAGEIRWNTDGTNLREAVVYDGEAIEIPATERVVIYARAEADGIETEKNFAFEPEGVDREIDDATPATLEKEVNGNSAGEIIRIITAGKRVQDMTFYGAIIRLGAGDNHVTVRCGDETGIGAEEIERLIASVRPLVGDEAPVTLRTSKVDFGSGFALREFAEAAGIEFSIDDIVQEA